MTNNRIFLFVHALWSVKDRRPLLAKPVRVVLFSWMQKHNAEKGIQVLQVNGVDDHVHCLIQVHPAQNLSQIIKQIKGESSEWLNENKLLDSAFDWQDDYAAYSVSPSGVKQVMDYIQKQEEHHKTKSLDSELEIFEKMQI